jgi:DNA (cytosine-5)-methyltransferase 1
MSPGGLLIPAGMAARYDRPVGIDLFAGCGGFSCGFHQAGFHVAAAVEYDFSAALTYLVNLARPGVKIHFDTDEREAGFTKALERHLGLRKPGKGNAASASAPRGQKGPLIKAGLFAGDGWISKQPASDPGCEHFWVADVRNLTGQQILDALGLERGEADAVVGGPPCQGFSVAGRRDVMDPRNSLVFEFVRLVLEIRPKTMVMENVPALLSMVTPAGVPVIDALCRILADGGFSTYDALKKSLLANTDAGAAMRRDKPVKRAKDAEDAEETEPAEELQVLF